MNCVDQTVAAFASDLFYDIEESPKVQEVFSGPLIEATFNFMDDIIERDRTKLTVKNYKAMAIIKTSLKRKKCKKYIHENQ